MGLDLFGLGIVLAHRSIDHGFPFCGHLLVCEACLDVGHSLPTRDLIMFDDIVCFVCFFVLLLALISCSDFLVDMC